AYRCRCCLLDSLSSRLLLAHCLFFFQAEDGIRGFHVTGVRRVLFRSSLRLRGCAMIPLGSLEAGATAHWLGTPFALAFGAIICAVSALVTLFVIQRREARNSK